MTDDATLSDFTASADEGTDSESPVAAASDRATDGCDADESLEAGGALDTVEFSTYAWGEHVCGRCEGTTERVWRDGDELVCPECKRW